LDGDEEAAKLEWPTLATFKEEGDPWGRCNERAFPIPRLNRVSREALGSQGLGAYNDDGTIPWKNREVMATEDSVLLPGMEFRKVGKGRRKVEFKGVGEEKQVDEMRLREMPEYLQDMLLWLYKSGGETKRDDLDD
jgi:hypothetical protein